MHVEVLVLRLLDDRALGHRWSRGSLGQGNDPDERALQLVGCSDGLFPSTSWRVDQDGRVVLTYAALPDPARDSWSPAPGRATATRSTST